MTPDVIALRAHLVAEVEYAKREALKAQRRANRSAERCRTGPVWSRRAFACAEGCATAARTATDAWLAADARLRALDGLIAASGVAVRP